MKTHLCHSDLASTDSKSKACRTPVRQAFIQPPSI
jgi:hypothetical protein